MEERQIHRGFSLNVSTRDDATGGSDVTLLIKRLPVKGYDICSGAPVPVPEHYRSLRIGPAAVGEAMERAKRAIDDALGAPDPLDDE
nr:hypothetical protein HUO10_005392 [Paraburkholderia busanensis]